MSKPLIAFLLFASAIVYNPPLVLNYFGSSVTMIGSNLKSALDIRSFFPKLGR